MAAATPWSLTIQLAGTRKVETRQVFASGLAEARAQISDGDTILSVSPWRKSWLRLPRGNRRAMEHTASLLRDLSARMRGGAPAESALLALIEDEKDNELRAALQPAERALRASRDAVAALEATQLIDPVALSILKSGQRMRDLEGTIEYAIEQMLKRDKAKATFAGRLGWVVGEVVASVGALAAYLVVVIPLVRNLAPSPEADAALNIVEIRCIAELALFMVAWLGGAWLMERHKSSIPERQDMLHRVPVLGAWFNELSIIDISTSLARMMRARMPATEAITALVRGARSPELRGLLKRAAGRIQAGTPLGKALAEPPFTDRERAEIRNYRTSDHLANILDSIVAVREQSANKARDRVIRWLFWIMFAYMSLTSWEGYAIAECAQMSADHSIGGLMNIIGGGNDAGSGGVP